MIKKELIEKNWNHIYKWLCEEGYCLGFTDDEIDDYVKDNYCHVFIGTKEEVEDEFEEDDYAIISQDDNWMIVESFTGTIYDGTEYGII